MGVLSGAEYNIIESCYNAVLGQVLIIKLYKCIT